MADDMADDKQTIPAKADDITYKKADGIIKADDKQTIHTDDIVCHQSQTEQKLQSLADDTDDKKTSYSNSPGIEVFQVGDRVSYIGGMVKHKDKVGIIISISNDRYRCYWDREKTVTEYLSFEEISK